MSSKKFSWKERGKSFVYAWQGIRALFRTEHNAWIHAALTVVAIALSLILKVSRVETIALVIGMSLVWITEIINTALEAAMNYISKERHPQIGLVKDLAAAAVLLAALSAVVVGGLIFLPKIVALF